MSEAKYSRLVPYAILGLFSGCTYFVKEDNPAREERLRELKEQLQLGAEELSDIVAKHS